MDSWPRSSSGPPFVERAKRLDLFGTWIWGSAQIGVLLALFWIRDDVLSVPGEQKADFIYPVAAGFVFAILFSLPAAAAAQGSASIEGLVRDCTDAESGKFSSGLGGSVPGEILAGYAAGLAQH